MNRPARALQFLVAVSNNTTAMASRSRHRGGGVGGGRVGRGRKQWGRGFSHCTADEGCQHLVTGDSHFQSVHDTNLGFRQEKGFNLDHNRQQPRHPQRFIQSQSLDHRPRPRKPLPLDYRNWEYAKTAPPPHAEKFIVLSYNILADYLAIDHQSKLYYHIPRHVLDWAWRKRSILFELGLWSADIMCFQEVDKFQDLEEELKPRGYSGIWKMRTGKAIDGCAVFWRTSRFKLLYEESIEFNKLGLRDNVAQICVLELINQFHTSDTSASPSRTSDTPASPSSSACPNKVVICNIHVLYNPKRGEIKLGQVRSLFERAHAVSKIWNSAPVVLCGDFNCTPKSPLYNFILEQKLDVYGLKRDKISGQASDEIRPSKTYCPSSGIHPCGESIQTEVMRNNKLASSLSETQCPKKSYESCESKPHTKNYFQPEDTRATLDAAKTSCPPGNYFQPEDTRATLDAAKTSCPPGQCESADSRLNFKETKEWEKNVVDNYQDDIQYGASVLVDRTKQSPIACPYDQSDDEIHKSTSPVISYPDKDIRDGNGIELAKENSGLLSDQGILYEHAKSNVHAETLSANLDLVAVSLGDSPPGNKTCLSRQQHISDEDRCISEPYQANISSASTSIYNSDNEKLEDVFPLEPNEGVIKGEDESTFLGALNDTKDISLRDFDLNLGSNLVKVSKECSSLNDSQSLSPRTEVVNDSLSLDAEAAKFKKNVFDPSLWTPMEIETATGSADDTRLEHPLKLRSTYADVEDTSGTRDPNGEPLVTSYNRCFMGTVDYIWSSEGLQTVRVLAPIRKNAMQWTPGFPTKKWGSDHISLASELAFVETGSGSNIKAQ
ncbi:hypothetical protein K2173_025842 [Erythroxylum novogranatense]|uniref:Endonuclease/exonuclease/phosphatase domain-containing protein n=1 Tax=Erythroxylum novogranatense TaxID=1862640 RepID=A0AAV8SIA8_9ROSI|nr:hypothetical protein K2173_025842 [Erythroxylum novogranatense]